MSRKLYVGNLPYSVTENSLRDLFSQAGTVESVKIVTDAFDGRSKGFGFVEMSSEEEAQAAVKAFNGTELDGRTLRVDLARPKENKPREFRGGSDKRRSSGGFNQDRPRRPRF